jgi:hypothetical protein
MAMARQVYLSERGDDKNDGLTPETPVLTGARAIKVSLKVKGISFHISGGDAYVRPMNAELEAQQGEVTVGHHRIPPPSPSPTAVS